MRNHKLNAAISAALGLGGLMAAPIVHGQTVATCATAETTAATPKLYIAGSSAAQTGFFSGLATSVFGGFGNMLLFNGTNSTGNSVTNFQAYCGTPVSGNPLNLPTSGIALIYYRAEGGSISGALPIAAGSNPPANTTGTGVTKQLQQLSINSVSSNSLCAASVTPATTTTPMEITCSIAGTSSANGATDSFGPTGLQEAYVDIGITDVEPGLLGATVNYPTAYATSVYGSVTAANLAGLTTTPAFSQTFGFFINNSAFTGGAVLDFSADTYRNIWAKNYTNWDQVPTSSGALASTTSVPIVLINREQGSGSRAAANVFLQSAGCAGGGNGVPKTTSGSTDGWATKEVLVEVGATSGAIGYASIDNSGKVTNANLANLNGLNPTPPNGNLEAAAGEYPFWYEAKYVQNAAAAGLNGGAGQDGNGTATTVQTAIFTNQALNSPVANVPHWKQIGIIPGSGQVGGTGGVGSSGGNITGSGTTGTDGVEIYINGFTRGGNSCARFPGEG
jgi:hypothetical protein